MRSERLRAHKNWVALHRTQTERRRNRSQSVSPVAASLWEAGTSPTGRRLQSSSDFSCLLLPLLCEKRARRPQGDGYSPLVIFGASVSSAVEPMGSATHKVKPRRVAKVAMIKVARSCRRAHGALRADHSGRPCARRQQRRSEYDRCADTLRFSEASCDFAHR